MCTCRVYGKFALKCVLFRVFLLQPSYLFELVGLRLVAPASLPVVLLVEILPAGGGGDDYVPTQAYVYSDDPADSCLPFEEQGVPCATDYEIEVSFWTRLIIYMKSYSPALYLGRRGARVLSQLLTGELTDLEMTSVSHNDLHPLSPSALIRPTHCRVSGNHPGISEQSHCSCRSYDSHMTHLTSPKPHNNTLLFTHSNGTFRLWRRRSWAGCLKDTLFPRSMPSWQRGSRAWS